MNRKLGTAGWEDPFEIEARYQFKPGTVFVGESHTGAALGFADEAHAMVVGRTRKGKGASIVVPTMLQWTGSLFCIDPKGENASVTAARRGQGSEYCEGLGQPTYVLDPFRASTVPDS